MESLYIIIKLLNSSFFYFTEQVCYDICSRLYKKELGFNYNKTPAQASACRREENGHNLDIWVLRLRQGQIQEFLGLKVRGALSSIYISGDCAPILSSVKK